MNQLATGITDFLFYKLATFAFIEDLGQTELVTFSLLSKVAIASSYTGVLLASLYIWRSSQNIVIKNIFILLAAFTACCATSYGCSVATIWYPDYWLLTAIELIAGLIALATAIALATKIPEILTLASPSQIDDLERKIAKSEQQQVIINQQELFLRSIYDNVQEAIFVVDVEVDGTFRYQGFNPVAKRLTGITDVKQKTPAQIFPPELASVVEKRYQKCLELGTTICYEECLPFEGKDTWWLTTINPIEDRSRIHRIIGTSLNIDPRKEIENKLEQEQVFTKAVLDNLADGIVACDENGILALFNRASQEFFAVPQEPLPPEAWAKHYGLYDVEGNNYLPQAEIPLFRAFSGESFVNAELKVIPRNSKPRILSTNGSPIINHHGVKIGAVVAIQDITSRKQAEQAWFQLNEELEDRVRRRTAQLEQVNALLLTTTETLEKRNQELDQFAYATSHDLRAPLRAIANLSEWIEEDLADKLDCDTRHNINLLRSRVHRMENIIKGLLDYSRIGRTNPQFQQVEVRQMLEEIIDSLDIPEGYEVQILGAMPTLVTELIPLQQIFYNLISNAVKHCECDRAKIKISTQDLGEYYEFSVSDNGVGIDPQHHARIFTIFQTLQSRDTKESTGIGLSIVKKAVENHGGTIEIESQLGKGSTFKFTWQKVTAIQKM